MISVYYQVRHLKTTDGTKYPLNYSTMTFSGGEEQVRIHPIDALPFFDKPTFETKFFITICAPFINSSKELIQLLLIHNAVRRLFLVKETEFVLELGYIPYARQDRVCYPGEAFSAEVLASLLQTMYTDVLIVKDPHSNVILSLLQQKSVFTQVVDQSVCFDLTMIDAGVPPGTYDYVIAPDKGAAIKASKVAKNIGASLLQATKVRDTDTGKICGIEFERDDIDLTNKKAIVVDDICDGGRTFIELAKTLECHTRYDRLDLYITHGIFSKGKEILLECFDNIYTHNEMKQGEDL